MSVLRELAAKAQINEDLLIHKLKTVTVESTSKTVDGAMASTYHSIALMPYKKWRVIRVGVLIHDSGASGVAEKFGFLCNRRGVVNAGELSWFGNLVQDATAGKQFHENDFFTYGARDENDLAPNYLHNNGNPYYEVGDGEFNKWQTEPGILCISKIGVASSSATGKGFMVVEIA